MIIIDIYVILLGLILGSFFNVVAIRLLKGESIVFPGSHCPSCQHKLSVIDLIPVFNYVWSRGKCRYCGIKVSPLYPFGELLTMGTIFMVYKHVGLTLELIPAFILTIVLVLAVLTDIREKLILDVITLPALVVILCVRIFIGEHDFWFYGLGGLAGFVLLLGIAVVSRGGMGGGDIKLYAFIGIALGPTLMVMSLILSAFFGAVVGLVLMALKVVKRKQPIPFAPFILLGTVTAYLYGGQLWTWYMTLF